MSETNPTTNSLLPPAEAVRDRLAHTVREARLLRQLLRLSLRAERDLRTNCQDRQEGARVQS